MYDGKLPKNMEKYRNRIDSIDPPMGGDEWWVNYAPGWCSDEFYSPGIWHSQSMCAHMDNAPNKTRLWDCIRRARPCDCEQCQPEE